jgi:hypothetical protein
VHKECTVRREYYNKEEEEEEEWRKEITKSVTREVLVSPHTLAREIQELGGGGLKGEKQDVF